MELPRMERHIGKIITYTDSNKEVHQGYIAAADEHMGVTIHGVNLDGTPNTNEYLMCLNGPSSKHFKEATLSRQEVMLSHYESGMKNLDEQIKNGAVDFNAVVEAFGLKHFSRNSPASKDSCAFQ